MSVRLVAQVRCDQPECKRMDEADDRPEASASAIGYHYRTAKTEFEARGWVFQPDGKTFCSDHYSTPRSPK